MTKAESLRGRFQRLAHAASKSSRRLQRRQHQRADRAHGAAFGRRGDAEEDRAEHQEDQHQRRDQDDDHLLGEARQQAELQRAVDSATT